MTTETSRLARSAVVGVPKMGAILPEGLNAFAARRLGSPACAAPIAAF